MEIDRKKLIEWLKDKVNNSKLNSEGWIVALRVVLSAIQSGEFDKESEEEK